MTEWQKFCRFQNRPERRYSFGLRKFPDSFRQAVSRAPVASFSLVPTPALPFRFRRESRSELAPGLQYFGCGIHGQLDLDEDGLVDLAVGALWQRCILWLVLPIFHYSWDLLRVLMDTGFKRHALDSVSVSSPYSYPIVTTNFLLWNHCKLFWSPNPSSQWGSEILESFVAKNPLDFFLKVLITGYFPIWLFLKDSWRIFSQLGGLFSPSVKDFFLQTLLSLRFPFSGPHFCTIPPDICHALYLGSVWSNGLQLKKKFSLKVHLFCYMMCRSTFWAKNTFNLS